ncbi:MAG: DUF4091 domain-containing protein [bacterium]|nr:DUF4091 domain-containing protein [bacterium]
MRNWLMMARWILLLMGTLAAALPAACLTMVFDFESPEDIDAWTLRSAGQDVLALDPLFATSGQMAAVFKSPAWEEGMEGWPAFEAKPAVTDWSQAATLMIDLVNPTDADVALNVKVTDSDTAFREGAGAGFTVRARSCMRAMVPLAKFPKTINKADIALVHFYTAHPPADYEIHVDSIALLAADEQPPAYPEAFIRQIVALLHNPAAFTDAAETIQATGRRIYGLRKSDPVAYTWGMAALEQLGGALHTAEQQVRAEDMDIDAYLVVRDQLKTIAPQTDRIEALAMLHKEWFKQTDIRTYAVGFASSMEKVLPRATAFTARVDDRVEIALARGERESFQVVVVPFEQDLAGVRIEVEDLAADDGSTLSADAIDTRVVGYVKTENPPYEVSHVGWWPDPLLDFLPDVAIEAGDVQSFWVRVTAPDDAAAGVYRGKAHVSIRNAPSWEFDLEVTVYDFSVPVASPLPTAMSVYDQGPKKLAGDQWDTVKIAWADFLADYYIDYDSLYRQGPPDYDILQHLKDTGKLVAFNLRYFSKNSFPADMSEDAFQAKLTEIRADARAIYGKATAMGIADKAYFYGYDEVRPEHFPVLEKIAAALKEELPDVPLMTTSYDSSFGLDSGVTSMDAWVPLTPSYDPDQVAKARAAGREVWWYICVGPRHPYANWFIEYPAIEARLLMGAMTAKYQPDGFLYYAITRWPVNDKPIDSGPFTDWNPASFKDNNGDGSMLCAGPGGRPLATIRLENFRDGLEDYAYAKHLREMVADARADWESLSGKQRRAVRVAEDALAVPDRVVTSMTEYTYDPQDVYDYRAGLARAIEKMHAAKLGSR